MFNRSFWSFFFLIFCNCFLTFLCLITPLTSFSSLLTSHSCTFFFSCLLYTWTSYLLSLFYLIFYYCLMTLVRLLKPLTFYIFFLLFILLPSFFYYLLYIWTLIHIFPSLISTTPSISTVNVFTFFILFFTYSLFVLLFYLFLLRPCNFILPI